MPDISTCRAAVRPDVLDLLASGEPPAFAVDQEHRITFWNKGASRVLGKTAADVLGHHCHEILQGRDVFGNRFCHAHCAVSASLRRRETVCGFDVSAADGAGQPLPLHVTILTIPGSRPEMFTAVHIFQIARENVRLGSVSDVRRPLAERRPIAASPPLTKREEQVLDWIAAGLQNKEIAHRLGISPATVRNHVHSVLEKLGVHSKLEAVSLALRNGWSRDPVPATPFGLAAVPDAAATGPTRSVASVSPSGSTGEKPGVGRGDSRTPARAARLRGNEQGVEAS